MDENNTFFIENGLFYVLIWNDKSKQNHVIKDKRYCKTNEYVFGGYTRLYNKY